MEVSPLYRSRRPDGQLPPHMAAVFDLLETLDIPYDLVTGEAADTMEKCAEVSRVLGAPICKNLFLCNRQKTRFYLLTMPPNKPFFTKELGRQINSSRLSFAPEEFLQQFLHCAPGSATALGLMHDTERQVQLVMDRETFEAEYFCCHPCDCTATLKLKTADLLERFLPHTGHAPIVVDLPEYST